MVLVPVARPLADLRTELMAKGVAMRELKSFPRLTGLVCGGEDPEGNQLADPVV